MRSAPAPPPGRAECESAMYFASRALRSSPSPRTPGCDRLLAVLAEHRIGAVVVSRDGVCVDGIASERDIVRAFAKRGAAVMSEAITKIYTAEVHTVTPETSLEDGVGQLADYITGTR